MGCALLFCHISWCSRSRSREYKYLKAIPTFGAGSRWSGALAHYKLVCQADGGIAPNWRQIKLATHYVLAKTFKLFWPPLPQLITLLFGALVLFPRLYCPAVQLCSRQIGSNRDGHKSQTATQRIIK